MILSQSEARRAVRGFPPEGWNRVDMVHEVNHIVIVLRKDGDGELAAFKARLGPGGDWFCSGRKFFGGKDSFVTYTCRVSYELG